MNGPPEGTFFKLTPFQRERIAFKKRRFWSFMIALGQLGDWATTLTFTARGLFEMNPLMRALLHSPHPIIYFTLVKVGIGVLLVPYALTRHATMILEPKRSFGFWAMLLITWLAVANNLLCLLLG